MGAQEPEMASRADLELAVLEAAMHQLTWKVLREAGVRARDEGLSEADFNWVLVRQLNHLAACFDQAYEERGLMGVRHA